MKLINFCKGSRVGRELFLALLIVSISALSAGELHAQGYDSVARGRDKDILNTVKKEIKNNYYDETYHGIDLNARFKAAEEKIDKATSEGQAFGIIAQAVLEFNDSHTKFFPPSRTARTEYGWRMQMIGDKCFVIAVKPGSDAEKQGLKAGDEIISIEGFHPTRKELWKVNYYYNSISPRAALNIQVKSPGAAEPRSLHVASKITTLKGVLGLEDLVRDWELSEDRGARHRFLTVGNTSIWKMPSFMLEPNNVDELMTTRIRGTNLILDLRGNGGGMVVALERLAGYFVDKDTKIADLKGRKEMKPQMAKSLGDKAFRGKLIVLVDSNSASASEIFAHFMQLQERAVVIGDQSKGAVMQSTQVPLQLGMLGSVTNDSVIQYGMNLTNADVIMSDGKSLEHVGVTPQLLMVPTAADLAAGNDPVMAAALKLVGENVTAEAAGKFFPFDWGEGD